MEAPPDGLLISFKIFGNLWRSLFQAFRFPSFFPSFSPRRIYLAPHLPWTPGTGHLRGVWDFCFLKQSKEKQKKEKNLPNLFTNQSRLAWPTRLLNLSSDVDVFEVIDWPAYHVFLQRRFANRNMRVYSWFSTRKRCSQKNKSHHYHWKKSYNYIIIQIPVTDKTGICESVVKWDMLTAGLW